MDIAQAFQIWARCDGNQDCDKCPLFDSDPEAYSVCNLFSEAHQMLQEYQIRTYLYMN